MKDNIELYRKVDELTNLNTVPKRYYKDFKIFDTNECFDYESKEYTSGELDKIVQKYFGPMAYLEPEYSVIFTICDVIIEN